jgi:hypothetical protein
MADEEEKPADGEAVPETPLGRFITKYSAFLSSFVIGAAGLIATSIWQYKQSEIARRQAESQQKVAEAQAANSWRIERAEILSKNLSILSSHDPATIEQRYGVLLSLTRGDIIDPELAVSYALELGKENPDFMKTVLSSTAAKNYEQMFNGFQLTCLQKYGVARASDACKNDKYSDRSDTIAQVISDEMDASNAQRGKQGPLVLLKDEHVVQDNPARLSWLFAPYLQRLYDRRQWDELAHFEAASTGAKLVSALVLATARTGEMVSNGEAARLDKFHADRRKWLTGYLMGGSCDPECKSRLVDVMLSSYSDSEGDYNEPLHQLLQQPRPVAGPAIGRLHQRLLWCQIDPTDEEWLRDQGFVGAMEQILQKQKPDPTMLGDLAGLMALVPEPTAEPDASKWKTVLAKLQKTSPDVYQKTYVNRRAVAERERREPSPAMRNVSFCGAPPTTLATPARH